MTRLAGDVRGNTLAMMGAFLVPIVALAGSAVDMARLYVVKVRLQQACDAGVLAGRKFMTGPGPALDNTADTQARTFFTNNFNGGWMQTSAVGFTPSRTNDNQVAGTATATVPMTIMKFFSNPDQTLNVTCEARYDVADTDIIFVLDTTGSMACLPSETDAQCTANNPSAVTYTRPATNTGGVAGYASSTGYRVPERMSGATNVSRIQALRTAVTDFYNTMATNVDPSTNIRYGFVTYSSMVNVGKAIMDRSPSYMIGGSGSGSWTYQSRTNDSMGDYAVNSGTVTTNTKTKTNCPTTVSNRTPATWYTSAGTATRTIEQWDNSTNKCTVSTNQTIGPVWQYKPVTYNVTNYVAGGAVQNPSVATNATSRWWGCIEERKTTAGQTSFNINNLPPDLDPDLVPSDDDTRWRPYWPDVEYERASYNSYDTGNGDTDDHESYTDPDRMKAGKNGCAKPAQRLKVMTATEVNNFVNAADFVPLGGTYHDIGMIWGVRFLSPTGIFAADTAPWPGRQAPKRVIVFLTDGAMSPSADAYGLYGVENLDRRVRNGASSPTAADIHNSRFLAECSKAKAMNIDVWTVAIAPAADTNLTACASNSDQAFHTTSGTGLSTYFQKIAKQIAMLRISQ